MPQIGQSKFARFADGRLETPCQACGNVATLTESEVAEFGNYLVASTTKLRSSYDAIVSAAIEAQQREAIDAALAVTEVIP